MPIFIPKPDGAEVENGLANRDEYGNWRFITAAANDTVDSCKITIGVLDHPGNKAIREDMKNMLPSE